MTWLFIDMALGKKMILNHILDVTCQLLPPDGAMFLRQTFKSHHEYRKCLGYSSQDFSGPRALIGLHAQSVQLTADLVEKVAYGSFFNTTISGAMKGASKTLENLVAIDLIKATIAEIQDARTSETNSATTASVTAKRSAKDSATVAIDDASGDEDVSKLAKTATVYCQISKSVDKDVLRAKLKSATEEDRDSCRHSFREHLSW